MLLYALEWHQRRCCAIVFYICWYMPWNGINADVVLMSFIYVGICLGMASTQMLCFITLTFIFKVNNFLLMRWQSKVFAVTVDVLCRFAATHTVPAVGLLLFPLVSTSVCRCVPVFVCVYVTCCVNLCYQVAKILKNTYIYIRIYPVEWSVKLTFNFKITRLKKLYISLLM